MLDKDHVLVSEAICLGTMPILFDSSTSIIVASALGTFIGAQVPDIDTASSKIGKCTKPLSTLIAHFGHRGITHSLLGFAFFTLFVSYFLRSRWLDFMYENFNIAWPIFLDWLIIGYALHLIEDWFSRSSVIWLFPSHVESYRKWYPPKLRPTGGYYSYRYLRRHEPPIYVRTRIAKWFRYHSTDRGVKGRYERNIRKIAIVIIIIELMLML